ncbi:MAG: hypothetical protein AAFZ17_19305, partial [Cyanobacteria bacterium J06650_10]
LLKATAYVKQSNSTSSGETPRRLAALGNAHQDKRPNASERLPYLLYNDSSNDDYVFSLEIFSLEAFFLKVFSPDGFSSNSFFLKAFHLKHQLVSIYIYCWQLLWHSLTTTLS